MPKKKILLVQDIQTQGNNTRMALEGLNYEVFVAGSGLTALVTARKAAADLILLDVALPDMEGSDLCSRFRQRDDTRSIPIILLVGHGYTPIPFTRPEEGPDDYLQKPCTSHDLQVKIDGLLRRGVFERAALLAPKPEPATLSKPESAPVPIPALKPSQRPVLRLVPKAEAKPSIQPPPPESAQAETTPEIIDPATGLFSRPQFEAMLSKEFKKCLRFKQQMSCIMIDLDGRKMGRTADAALIKAIIGLVQNTIREVDTAAWWTGESLIVLLPQTLRGDAMQAAARVLEAVAVYPFTWPDATRVTMSIGVAGLPDKNIDSERKLIEAAAEMCKRALDMMVPVPESLRYEPRKWKPPASGTNKGKG